MKIDHFIPISFKLYFSNLQLFYNCFDFLLFFFFNVALTLDRTKATVVFVLNILTFSRVVGMFFSFSQVINFVLIIMEFYKRSSWQNINTFLHLWAAALKPVFRSSVWHIVNFVVHWEMLDSWNRVCFCVRSERHGPAFTLNCQ